MSKFCQDCGFKNPDTAKFCSACGRPVAASKKEKDEKFVLKSGSVLNGRYIIEKFIKVGGMGAVYKAKDKNLDKYCAVKELRPAWINPEKGSDYFIKKFETEAKLLSRLHHIGLPRVIDYFNDEDCSYLIMDFIDGYDLKAFSLKKGTPGLPQKKVIEWGIEICDILEYLHNYNPPIIYRDLKPANIMIKNYDKKVVLIDFGIACIIDEMGETTRTTIGTMGYIAPEQYLGKPVAASDIYSLGATLYYLLSGTMPVPFGDYHPIKNVIPAISSAIDEIICKALKRKLEERYKKIEDIKKDLENILSVPHSSSHDDLSDSAHREKDTEDAFATAELPKISEPEAGEKDTEEMKDSDEFNFLEMDDIPDVDFREVEGDGELGFMDEDVFLDMQKEDEDLFISLDLDILEEADEEKIPSSDKIHLNLLEDLLEKKDLGSLIPILLVNKEKLNEDFFKILDREIKNSLVKNKKKSDELAYLNRILLNLKIRKKNIPETTSETKGPTKKELARKYFNEAQNLITQEKFGEVIKLCKKALKFDSEFQEVYYTLGTVYKKVNRPDLVIENYKKYLALKQKKATKKI